MTHRRTSGLATALAAVLAMPLAAQPRATLRPLVVPEGEPRMMCLRGEHADSTIRTKPVVWRTFVFGAEAGEEPGADGVPHTRQTMLVTDSAGRLILLSDGWTGGPRGGSLVVVAQRGDTLAGTRVVIDVDSVAANDAIGRGDLDGVKAAVRQGPPQPLARPALDSALAVGAWLFAKRCGR
jgi:hypothetical protein